MSLRFFPPLLLIGAINLYAYVDTDLDGVEDLEDKCPNTPFMDLVNSSGCSVNSLVSSSKFDLIVGAGISQIDNQTLQNEQTLYTSLQIDYSYKKFFFYAQLSTYTNEDENGLNDTQIGGGYTYCFNENWKISPQMSIILPTYRSGLGNEAADYSAGFELASYIDTYSLFTAYTYTMINDTDTNYIKYQNTSSYQFGIGHTLNDSIYIDGGYYTSKSIYQGVEDIENFLFDLNYYIDDGSFIILNYYYGLSDSTSDHYVALKYGINF